MDGLMFDTEPLYYQVGTELLARRGHEFSPQLQQQMMGRPGPEAIQVLIDTFGLSETAEDLLAESDQIFSPMLEQPLRPMPGLFELLEQLDGWQIRFGVATSSKRVFARQILGRFDILDRLTFLLTGDDVRHGKPHPEMYLKAAQQFDIAAQNMAVFEDSRNGCLAAVAAGACTVAVPGEHNQYQQYPNVALTLDTLGDDQAFALLRPRG